MVEYKSLVLLHVDTMLGAVISAGPSLRPQDSLSLSNSSAPQTKWLLRSVRDTTSWPSAGGATMPRDAFLEVSSGRFDASASAWKVFYFRGISTSYKESSTMVREGRSVVFGVTSSFVGPSV